MLREGKAAGWLQLPTEAFLPWARLNDVQFERCQPAHIDGKGGALVAKTALDAESDESRVLLTVPRDLILSLERVQEHAKADQDFREVLGNLGEFGRTSRGAILTFLLVQACVSCPGLSAHVSVHSAFVDYISSLPLEDLPTFWPPSELSLLVGTTLAPAVSSKLRSLHREYDQLCSSAAGTRWFGIVAEHISFEDWLHVDAMYRSRALDFPGIGHCMIPGVDLANHAAHEETVAIYEKSSGDDEAAAVLLLRDGKKVADGAEVTITYGDEKGACEMLFSYGFLDRNMASAGTLFLSLAIPDGDRLRAPKARMADCAPGFKLIDAGGGEIDWTGDYVWLLCVNDDDGLRFEVARTVDGEADEVHGFFGSNDLSAADGGGGGAALLRALLAKSELWDVYRLRALTILQTRVFDQLQMLYGSLEDLEGVHHGEGAEVRDATFTSIMKLRQLEFELMERAYDWFENEKNELAQSEVVQRYLAAMKDELAADEGKGEEEDFS